MNILMFSLDLLNDALLEVGEGGYGSVWKVETNDDVKRFFAAKKVKMSNRDSKKLAMKELDILKILDCQHIIKLEDYFDEPKVFL